MKVKFLYSIVFFFFLVLVPVNVSAQKSNWYQVKKANKLRNFGKIDKAIKKYDAILVENPTNSEANFQLGKLYLLDIEEFGKAEKYLSTSVKNFSAKDTIYMAYYYLAETEKLLGNFPQAIENYETFKNKGIKDQERSKSLVADVNTKIDECKLAQINTNEKKYTFTKVINLGDKVNSNLSEYCSVFLPKNEQLLYTARYRDSDREKRFMDFKFYEGGYSISDTGRTIEGPSRMKFDVKNKAHFSVVSKTNSGDTVIFYKDNKLWLSEMVNGSLSTPRVLPEKVNRSYYQPHGVFSSDNKQFIFSSSDKKLQLDLYSIDVNGDNSWGTASILSDKINTKYNEDGPFYSKDGKTLYFSSNKPGGYGKYDIYFSKFESGEWGDPKNIGMPINSAGEDIFFSLNNNNETGFLSSNRGGGFGSMDIYMFTEQPYPSFDCEEYFAENGNKGKNKINVLDELVANEIVRFDVMDAKLNGAKVSNVFWKVDDQILKLDNSMLTWTFTDTGRYAITTQIYGKNMITEEYEMDCSVDTFLIKAEGPLFLEIAADRMVKVNTSAVIDAETFYLGQNKTITNYDWYIDGKLINDDKQSYTYSFADTGFHDLRVIATINDKARDVVTELSSEKQVFVYDESHNVEIAQNGDAYIPGIELYENKNPLTGKINAVKANVYGVPDDRRIFYSWYINNEIVKGRQTELLTYDFKPLSVIKVKAFIMHESDEPEFTLEATKVIPEFGDDAIASNSDSNSKISDQSAAVNVDGTKYEIKPVYFLFDKYFLTAKAKAIINENIKALKSNPSLMVVVEGNTDSMGPSAYNLRLSEKRAKSVYKYLKSKGITDAQIQGINSNGEKIPKAPNTVNGKDNPTGRQENRRVDFTIVKK